MAFDLRRLLGMDVPQLTQARPNAHALQGGGFGRRIQLQNTHNNQSMSEHLQPAVFSGEGQEGAYLGGGNISFAGSGIGRGLSFEKGASQIPQGMGFGAAAASRGLTLPSDYNQYGFNGLSGVDGLAPATAPQLRPSTLEYRKKLQQY